MPSLVMLRSALALRRAPRLVRGVSATRSVPFSSRGANPTPGPEAGPQKGPVSWPTLALLVTTGGGLVAYYNIKKEQRRVAAASKVETYGDAALGGPWTLVDATGRPTTSGDLLGQYYLLYFGFTYCPDICPNELVKMGRVIDALKKDPTVPSVRPVFVTLDPHRDSCAQVGVYAKDFSRDMLALTGTPKQIAKIAKAYRVYFADVDRKGDDDEDYLVDHSIVMYLVGPDGRFVDFYTQIMTAPEISDRIRQRIAVEPTPGFDIVSIVDGAIHWVVSRFA